MYSIAVDADLYGMDSRALLRYLGADGIQCRPIWQPMHISPAHFDAPAADCPIAGELYERVINIPCAVGLGDRQEMVIDAVGRRAGGGAT